MSRQILAIDIRTHSLSAVFLTSGIKSLTIEAAVVVPYEQGPDQQDPLQGALIKLDGQLPMTDATVNVGLPGGRSYYRSLAMPFSDPKKIRQILAFELEPTLPVPVERIVFDFAINPQHDNAAILAAITDRHYLDFILDSFSHVGLEPQLIVPGGFALAAVLANHPHLPEQYLLMDVDVDQAHLFALSQGRIRIVRSMQFDINADDAIEGLVSKIRQTLTGYNDPATTALAPTTLYLTGAALSGHNPVEQMAERLNMTIELLNLSQSNPKIETAIPLAQWQPLISDGALALAVIHAEGTPGLAYHRTGSAFDTLWDTYKSYIKGPIFLSLFLILIFLVGVFWDIHVLQQRVDQVQGQISTAITAAFPDVKRISERPADQMRSKLTELKTSLADPTHAGSQVRIIDILYQISDLIPNQADVLLNRLVVGGDSITIAGETIDFNTVEDVQNRLESSELFDQVEITNSDRDKSGQKVRFRLKIDL